MSWTSGVRDSLLGRLLRLQLGGLLALFLLLFLLLDWSIDREIYQRLDAGLLDRARSYAVLVAVGHEAELRRAVADTTRQGVAILQPAQWPQRYARALPRVGQPRYFDTRLVNGEPARAVALALTTAAGTRILVLSESRADADALERQLHYTLLIAIAFALLLAAAMAGYALRRGLRPLTALQEDLGRLDLDHLPEHLPARPLPRELLPLHETLDATLSRLTRAVSRERDLLREIAHELRTPLAEMRSGIEVAMRERHDDAVLTTTLDALLRLQAMTDSLLMLARYETGQAKPLPEPLDLSALLRTVQRALSAAADERCQRLQMDLPLESWTSSDPVLLERIIDNLLRNAIDHAPRGDVIAVRLEESSAGRSLCINNAAPALSADDVQQMGRRFWRRHPEDADGAHAGLGLALVMTLAQVLGLGFALALRAGRLEARLGPFPPLPLADEA